MNRFIAGFVLFALALPVGAQTIAGTYRGNDVMGLRNAVERSPDNVGLRLRLTQALLRRERASAHPDAAQSRLLEARKHFRTILDADPKAPVPLRVMTLDSYLGKNLQQTVQLGTRLLAQTPDDREIARHVLKALLRLGRSDEAAAFFVEWLVTGLAPPFGAVQGLISTLVLSDKFREALGPRLEAAVKERPGQVDLRLYRAIFLMEIGRAESAWQVLHEAEELGLCDTRSGSRHAFVAILTATAAEFKKTSSSFEGVDPEDLAEHREKHPKNAGLAMRHARLLDLAGRRREALQIYAEVRGLNPDYWPAWFRPGQMLMEDGKASEAAPLLAKARELAPRFTTGNLAEAEAWARGGEANRAVILLRGLATHHEPGSRTEKIVGLLGESDEGAGLDSLVKRLREDVATHATNPYVQAHLALALRAHRRTAEAQKVALAAEKRGLVWRDGYPARLLYEVFGEKLPPELESKKRR